MNNQNNCLACSCPCEMHRKHNHAMEKKDKEEYSMTCSRCGLKTKGAEGLTEHASKHNG